MVAESFRIPSLLWDLGHTPVPTFVDSAGSGPWCAGAIERDAQVTSLLSSVDLIYKAFNAAGYHTDDFAYASIPGGAQANEVIDDWVQITDVLDCRIRGIDDPWPSTIPVPEGTHALVAITVRRRLMFVERGVDYSVPLSLDPFVDPSWLLVPAVSDIGPAAAFEFQFAMQEPQGTEPGRIQLAVKARSGEDPPLKDLADACSRAATIVWASVMDDLIPDIEQYMLDPDPAEPRGLLGVFDARRWSFAREVWSNGEKTLREIGTAIHGVYRGYSEQSLAEAFASQVSGGPPLWLELRSAFGRAKGRKRGAALGAAMRERYIDLRGDVSREVSVAFGRSLVDGSWFDALLRLHSLDLVDILGSAHLAADFDVSGANRSQLVDVTGFYESVPWWEPPAATAEIVETVGSWAEIQTIQLNQAGDVLTGYWQTRLMGPDRFVHLHQHRVTAIRRYGTEDRYDFNRILTSEIHDDLTADPAIMAESVTGQVDGAFSFTEGGSGDGRYSLTITFSSPGRLDSMLGYRSVTGRPHLAEAALDSAPLAHSHEVRAEQRWPLHTNEAGLWDNVVVRAWEGVKEYIASTDELALPVVAEAIELDHRDRAAWFFQFSEGGAIGESDQAPLLHRRAAVYLARRTLTHNGDKRTAYEWMANFFVDRRRDGIDGVTDVPGLQNTIWLWDSAIATERPFIYEWVLWTWGVNADFSLPIGAGIGGMAGFVRITKKNKATGATVWSQRYATAFLSGGVNFLTWGIVLYQESYGQAEWPVDWSQPNFEGTWQMTVLGSGVASLLHPGPGELADPPPAGELDDRTWAGESYGWWGQILFRGDGTWAPMYGPSNGKGRLEGFYAGGLDGTIIAGTKLIRVEDDVEPSALPQEVLDELGSVEVTQATAVGDQLFEVDDDELTAAGWTFLKRLAADHRAALETPWSFLRLVGHASTTGDAVLVNLDLSKRRAEVTYEALRACLGPAFAVHEDRTFVNHRGEYDASLVTPPDTEDDDWRRVDIWIDSNVLVGL